MNYEQALHWIASKHTWTARWMRLGCVTVKVAEPRGPEGQQAWQAKDIDKELPKDAIALGCSGLSLAGTYDWIGWDMDVGHGPTSYVTREHAIADALRLREKLKGCAEVRLSKSGKGVHIRHTLETPAANGPELAKDFATRQFMRIDRSVCGRQCLDFWTRTPGDDSFKLIAEHA